MSEVEDKTTTVTAETTTEATEVRIA